MIIKYYTCNIANGDGEVICCCVVRAWFFRSPLYIIKWVSKEIKKNHGNGFAAISLRRMK